MWINEFGLAEIKVVELCISRVLRSRRNSPTWNIHDEGTRPAGDASEEAMSRTPGNISPRSYDVSSFPAQPSPNEGRHTTKVPAAMHDQNILPTLSSMQSQGGGLGQSAGDAMSPYDLWSTAWQDPSFGFPEVMDLETWKQMINNIATYP